MNPVIPTKTGPSTTIIAAELGPLQSEGKTPGNNLQSDGVPVLYKMYKGTIHEFFGMSQVVPEAKDAEALAATELKILAVNIKLIYTTRGRLKRTASFSNFNFIKDKK